MVGLSRSPIAYRHVIFPETLAGPGLAIDRFTPPRSRSLPPGQDRHLSLSEQDCLRRLFRLAGLDLDDYRPETIKRRIPACLRAVRVEHTNEIGPVVQRHPQLLDVALSALVIGVTSFFRDPATFTALNERVLPELLAHNAGPRVWSAGCSDGAELYSLAMVLAHRGALQRSSLLGTDCRVDAIVRAKEGCFDPAAVKNVPAEFLGRYLSFNGARWRVHPYLRTAAHWRSGNVLTTPAPGPWDLILCRNLAIYMQPAAVERLWGQLEQSLRPGGFVVLGKAERPNGTRELVQIVPSIYRRDGGLNRHSGPASAALDRPPRYVVPS